jgi:uncharacterized membrane protein
MSVILITLLATAAIQIGYFLWKVSANSLPQIGKAKTSEVIWGFLFNGKWLMGLLATIIGWFLFVKATGMGEISLVQPLMSVGDILLVLMAVVFLKERLITWEWIGLFLTVLGAGSLSLEVDIISEVSLNWSHSLIYIGCACLILVCIIIFQRNSKNQELILALAVGFGFGIGSVLTKLMTIYIHQNNQSIESLAFILNPILPFMIAANFCGLFLLQLAFQKGRAAVIIPVQLSVVNGIAVLSGIFLFSEKISLLRLACIFLIVIGTICLQWAGGKKAGANIEATKVIPLI